jgi:T4 superinfection immunity protein
MFHVPFFFCLLALYFLPSLIAGGRHLREHTTITLLNLFLGWTFIGWIVALIWAIAAPAPYVVYVRPPYPPYYR